MGFVNEKNADEWRTIDYERNIILKDIGGHPNDGKPMRFFEIEIKGRKLTFNAFYNEKYDQELEKSEIFWSVESLPEFKSYGPEDFKSTIEEALQCYGIYSDNSAISKCEVKFTKNP